ncbi:MAG: hypothetical protein V7L25_21500 [Nostoc sp.]|uniref:hypothetical protein n=1 Tax=Nostoc sp. TaxID=1180 RepID=UPI002FF113D2
MNGDNNITKVLIAHITEDKKAAEKLQEQLLVIGGPRLQCLLWEENKQNRLENLRDKICETDILLLLVASAVIDDEDWSWLQRSLTMSCTMENGHVSRIVLHNKALTPPSYIKAIEYHSFKSEINEINEFLRHFFGSTDFTRDQKELNQRFTQNTYLDDLSKTISSLFQETQPPLPVKEEIYLKAITLIVENPDGLTRENLPQRIRVQAKTPKSLEIFDMIDTRPRSNDNWTWKEIVNNLPSDSNQGWVRELEESIYLAHDGRRESSVVQWTFQSSDGILFRPILYRMENGRDGSERFTVLFVKHISEGWVNKAPNIQLATLLTALILGARLQWEVCANYLPQLDTWQRRGTEAIQKGLRQVKVSFENIEEDAKIREQAEAPGQKNKDRLRDSFDSENERQTIENNMLEQDLHKQTLCNADQQDNIDEVKVALIELARLNRIVTIMVARQYLKLLNDNYS